MVMQRSFIRGEVVDANGQVVATGELFIRRSPNPTGSWVGRLSPTSGSSVSVSPGEEYKLRLPNDSRDWPILIRSVPGALARSGPQGSYVQFDGNGESPI